MLRTRASRRRNDSIARWAFRLAAATTFAVTVAIIATLAFDAWDFLVKLADSEDGLGALNTLGWFPRRGLFDIGTLVVGTLMVTIVAMCVAIPLGVGTAIYLAEYARPGTAPGPQARHRGAGRHPQRRAGLLRHRLHQPQPRGEDLRRGRQGLHDHGGRASPSASSPCPIVASVTEDALRAVPLALREASFGLGAKRSQTTFRVVFPAAISGIVAALILGISRAIGETMVVAIAAGAVGGSLFHTTPLKPGQTMTAAMAALGFGSDQVAGNNLAFQSLYFVGALLFLITLALNVLGDRLVNRVREIY